MLVGVFAAGSAWADGHHSSDDNLFELDCVEWSDAGTADAGVNVAGLSGADGGTEVRCIKYQTPYGCSSAGGPLGLGLLALLFRKRSR